MSVKTIIATAVAALLLTPAAALAARATTTLNVRSGPSTAYGVVDSLRPGEHVNVRRCIGNGWCEISHRGPDGWVSGSYLAGLDRSRGGVTLRAPGFSLSIGSGRMHHRRHRHGEVCFFQRHHYRGPSFCARPGQSDHRLRGIWNNRISSIRVRGDARAEVCRKRNFRRCTIYTHSVPRLPGNNNIISSYRVLR
jgi:uncharacterized protein YraI